MSYINVKAGNGGPSARPRSAGPPKPTTRRRRAYIYDDDGCILSILNFFFTERNYEVVTYQKAVVCPLDAEAFVCSNHCACADIVITDFMMPGMNGIDLLLSQFRKGCKIPTHNKALISGFADHRDAEKILALGCSFFKKPLDFNALAHWLDELEKKTDVAPLSVL